MAKQIILGEKARTTLKKGMDKVADSVRITMGPRGRNVALDKGYGSPTITNDGVTIAKEIVLKNKFENIGAEILKEVATKTNDTAGDGTTTSIVLTHALIDGGMKKLKSGMGVLGVKIGIEKAVEAVTEALIKSSKQIKSDKEIEQVATISAEDNEIGKIIASTIKKVGQDGVVTVEESPSFGITSEIVEGLEIDKGYVSAYMVTDAERMEAKYKEIPVLLTDKKISTVKEILPFIERLAATGKKDLMIIADDIDGEALTTFVLNKLRGGFNVLGIKAPGFGAAKKELLQDIAVKIGAKVISDDIGTNFENAELNVLGKATVVATKDKTLIVSGNGSKAEVTKRVNSLRALKKNTESKFDKEKLDQRIAKLVGGVAVIRVGAATETEMKYLKLKIEDAVNATKAAIEEGIVAGGGTALLKAAVIVRSQVKEPTKSTSYTAEEFKTGFEIVLNACEVPLKQILVNAGVKETSKMIKQISAMKGNGGIEAVSMETKEDMIASGVIDPLKVTRTALQNAASAAAIFLTTEVAITDEPKEDKNPTAPGLDY